MKKTFFTTISLIVISFYATSQVAAPDPVIFEDSVNYVYAVGAIHAQAIFPGGTEGWKKHLQRNLNSMIPYRNGAPQGMYHVVVMFTVYKDGSVGDYYPETNFGYGMEEEVIRVIKKGPRWKPAIRYGRKVNSYIRQPVIFEFTNRFKA